jgi:hypothetical protein
MKEAYLTAVLGLLVAALPCIAVAQERLLPQAFPATEPGWSEFQEHASRPDAVDAEDSWLRESDVQSNQNETGVDQEGLSWSKAGGWRIVPFGTLDATLVSTSNATVARDFVMFASPKTPPNDKPLFNVHGKASSIGFQIEGPKFGEFQSSGMLYWNFFGATPIDNVAGLFYVLGFGELRNENWRFAFGQNMDLINPRFPTMVNFGMGLGAGNIGFARGQVRAERFFQPRGDDELALQLALSQQVVGDFAFDPVAIGTDNGWPNIEGRIAYGTGPIGLVPGGMLPAPHRPFEVGFSGLIGETRASGELQSVVDTTWAMGADARVQITEKFGVQGEFFYGQAIGTYVGGVGQSLNITNGRGIRSAGGWGELWYFLCPNLHTHWGYGIDNPLDQDVSAPLPPPAPQGQPILRNEFYFANLMWDVTPNLQLAFEVSHYDTEYVAPLVSNDAVVFQSRVQLRF